MDVNLPLYLIALVFLLACSAFFSGSETALYSLKRIHRERLRHAKTRGARTALALLERPTRTIVAILIGNELVNIAASVTATSLVLTRWGPEHAWLAVAFMLPLILIFGELTPKSIAVTRAERVASLVAPPLLAFSRLITPLQGLLKAIVDWILRLLRVSPAFSPSGISENEFKTLLNVGRQEGVVDPDEQALIERVLAFGDMRVHQVMTPRTDMFCLQLDLSFEEALEAVKQRSFSRIPVYHQTIDRIVGILYARDLLQAHGTDTPPTNLNNLLHPPFFVPETKQAGALLTEFQRRRRHLAIVVDEYGGTAGLVTLEDLLEELFGEITDEFDTAPRECIEVEDGTFRVSAMMPVAEFNERFHANFPTDETDTIGGLLFHFFGKVPVRGERLIRGPFALQVEQIEGSRLREILVTIQAEPQGEGTE